MSALRFNVVYEDADEGWVYAHVPELPEVQTQGEDLEQARSEPYFAGREELPKHR